MKRVLLVETQPEGMRAIMPWFAEINAHCTVAHSVEEAARTAGEFDLLVLLAPRQKEGMMLDVEGIKGAPSLAKLPRVLLFPPGWQARGPVTTDFDAAFALPVDKLRFLAAIARILKVPPRRRLRIVVGVQPQGGARYSGLSVDFSENGMAFVCDADIPAGGELTVGFVNPRTRNKFLLGAVVMHKGPAPDGAKNFYGVRFTDMTQTQRRELSDFVTGEG